MIERLWMISLQAAALTGIISILRLFLAKSPRVYSYALWLIVLFRLLCPVVVASPLSLWPDMQHIRQWEAAYGRPGETAFSSPDSSGAADETGEDDAVQADETEIGRETARRMTQKTPADEGKMLLKLLWITGAVVTAFVFWMQYIFLHRRIRTAILEEGNVYRCEHIGTPFVMGLYKPRIYLPYDLTGESGAWILLHEKMHIRHRDHLTRAAEVLALCLHWWNPAAWYAVHQLNQDMEMFCDEAVLAGKDKALRKGYAETLLDFAVQRSSSLLRISFGRSNTEKRVRHVLSGKIASPGKTIVVAAIMVFLAAGFLTVPAQAASAQDNVDGLEKVRQAGIAVSDKISVQTKQEETPAAAFDMESVSGISREQADLFLEELIYDAAAENREQIAEAFAYPVTLSLEGKKVQIENEEELLLQYEGIFTDRLLEKMELWRAEVPFYNWQGVCWGDGTLWLQRKDGEIKIAALQYE